MDSGAEKHRIWGASNYIWQASGRAKVVAKGRDLRRMQHPRLVLVGQPLRAPEPSLKETPPRREKQRQVVLHGVRGVHCDTELESGATP